MVGFLSGMQNVSVFYPQHQMNVPAERTVPGTEQREPGHSVGRREGRGRDTDTYECQTCENRRYKDGSDDPGVSFKTPTKIDRNEAPAAVRSHESEHVGRERAKAQREGREVISQSVTYKTAVCPECGRTYVAGGTTFTLTRGPAEGSDEGETRLGQYLDVRA